MNAKGVRLSNLSNMGIPRHRGLIRHGTGITLKPPSERPHMLHSVILASSDPVAAGMILRGIKGIFVAIGSIIAAFVCAIIAATKGRNPLGWGILGLFFSILTLIVVIVIPSKK
ncbi:hypothetical protein [Mycobacterium sp. IS-1264]|uniref:hypothetical protein n=1 Tax=Mycobacterium sp. IS-1264 TaxID=1834158 RepID=UPI001F0ABAD8|nr:hypothetical protein [Mycobacterium sp. IS-1264]